MDSITHVILGAACGEIVLGKKLGNRAMIWGSLGGSLPDFDVLSGFFVDPLNSMVFHRGPMHSLVFVIIMPFVLGPLLKMLYDGNWHKKKGWKITGYSLGIFLYSAASVILCLIWSLLFEGIPWIPISILLISGIYFFYKRYVQIFKQENEIRNASIKEWIQLFAATIIIHPLLDALTTYGTVLFWPFSNVRIAVSNIAIADPLYTIPFAVFIFLAALAQRGSFLRRTYTWIGLAISSCYLILTFINKQHVDKLFENSLKSSSTTYSEYITVPTILNNLLWYAIAKQDSGYVYGYYSLFDKEKPFSNLHFVPGNHHLLLPYRGQTAAELLPWFSNDYYNVIQSDEKIFQYNDLRYGSMSGEMNNKEDYIFKFNLIDKSGTLEMMEDQKRPDNKREDVEWFKRRIFGGMKD